jgi:hypothetical protein
MSSARPLVSVSDLTRSHPFYRVPGGIIPGELVFGETDLGIGTLDELFGGRPPSSVISSPSRPLGLSEDSRAGGRIRLKSSVRRKRAGHVGCRWG